MSKVLKLLWPRPAGSIRPRSVLLASVVAAGLLGLRSAAQADGLERMKLDNLKAVHVAVESLKADRVPVSLPSRFTDYRGVMHVHSGLSHDSRSTVEEIVGAANQTGVKVIMFSEHPAPHYDYFKDGHRGMVKGVLLIPGAEQRGLQLYPQASIPKEKGADNSPQAQVDAVIETKGQAFLCHLEERMDWELDHLTGSEIYNVHADFKDEARMLKAMRNPFDLLPFFAAYRNYPQEAMAALMDYPSDYLRRYDELCQRSRLTGVAANDAHHNIGYKGIVDETGKLQLVDNLGKEFGKLDPKMVPAMQQYFKPNAKQGDVAFHLDFDPYERSFRYVCTHMLLSEQTEPAVREALNAGRVYVSFDWIGDPTGFNFQATRGADVLEMGSECPVGKGLSLRSVSPLPARFRLIRNGKEVDSSLGRSYEHQVAEPGNYRMEVWVNVAESPRIWILSNPIYVRAQAAAK